MKNISKLDNQTSICIFSKQKIDYLSNRTSKVHVPLDASRFLNICVCGCVHVNAGFCTRHNLRRTDYIQICKQRIGY